jgi:hypothetical protein
VPDNRGISTTSWFEGFVQPGETLARPWGQIAQRIAGHDDVALRLAIRLDGNAVGHAQLPQGADRLGLILTQLSAEGYATSRPSPAPIW